MHHDQRCSAGELNAEVAIADGVQAVPRDLIEAESAGDRFAIDSIRSSRQRRCTEGQYIDSLANLGKSFAIARQHFKICQTPVSE